MKNLQFYLEDIELEIDRDTTESCIVDSIIDIIYDDYRLLFNHFEKDISLLEDLIEIEIESEYMDNYHTSYYFHLYLQEELNVLFAEAYPELII